ncbi:Hypothetical protein PHPALM_9094 [Phytophthora palmivora]|uniref:Uncharacterized protein n=1 Tax=Phytophthora palmivora TaxID=4796 RepID=A0A2P4Y8J1_9STRA|nr:Hypothetical protein PHPALM_9094 [Phytophthora palmivora]
MFNPAATDGAMQHYQADKLQHWAMTMTSYRYVIEHIRGSENVWADMLSRWGNSEHVSSTGIVVVPAISPLQNDNFQWPTLGEVRAVQNSQENKPDIVSWSEERSCFVVGGDRLTMREAVNTVENAQQQLQLDRGAGGRIWLKM